MKRGDRDNEERDFEERPPKKKSSAHYEDNNWDHKGKSSKYDNKDSQLSSSTTYGEKSERGGNFKTRGGTLNID